jgi:hypothetical protein
LKQKYGCLLSIAFRLFRLRTCSIKYKTYKCKGSIPLLISSIDFPV